MLYSTRLKAAAATIGMVAVASIGATASASPGSGITSQTFTTSNLLDEGQVNHERIKFQTKDPTTVRVQKLVFAPGAFTGYHHHPGLVVVAVESGFVTLVDSNCRSLKTYGPGSADGSVFIEGDDDAHQAISMSGATVYVTYVSPSSVFRVEEPLPPCAR